VQNYIKRLKKQILSTFLHFYTEGTLSTRRLGIFYFSPQPRTVLLASTPVLGCGGWFGKSLSEDMAQAVSNTPRFMLSFLA
jgi:hypothetical protein